MRVTASKALPHRKNGSPAGTSTGRPRTTPRRGSRPLTNGHGPRLSISCLASARASAPAAGLPLARGRGTTTGQRPRRLGLSPAARLWRRGRLGAWDGPTLRRRGRGISPGAMIPAWPLFWCSHLAGRRRRLEADPRGSGRGETPSPRSRRCRRRHRRHRPRWGILLQAPPLPGLCSTRL